MSKGLSRSELEILHGLQEESDRDSIFKLDRDGFILPSSDVLRIADEDVSSMLLPPRLSDLADPSYRADLDSYTGAILHGHCFEDWFEFPLTNAQTRPGTYDRHFQSWHAVKLRRIANNEGVTCGALGLMRSVGRIRCLENELLANVCRDPLTGLINRRSFFAKLRGALVSGMKSTIILLSIDRLRAILLEYGQRTADELLCGFAQFLETMAEPDHDIAQLDGERFGVILRGVPVDRARRWAQELIATFASLALPERGKAPKLSISIGLAQIEKTVDSTFRQAEIALVMARAGGGMQLAHCRPQPRARICDSFRGEASMTPTLWNNALS